MTSVTGIERSSLAVGRLQKRSAPVALGLSLSLILALASGVFLTPGSSARLVALVFVAALIGAALQRASFGFSSAFRLALSAGNTYGLRVHAVMLMLTSVFFLPLLSAGAFAGQTMTGFGAGLGITFAVGALMFGAGMQLSGGCASGTLFALGGGNGKPLATVAGFVIGSTLAAAQIGFWWSLPATEPIFIQTALGLPLGLVTQIGLLGAFYWLARNRSTRPYLDTTNDGGPVWPRLLRGPWPLLWGAVALALLNVATLVLSGQPWGETSAFALWGSMLLDAGGFHQVREWTYWSGDPAALDRSLLLDVATLMDMGIVLGAMAAAASGGVFTLRAGGSPRIWLAALCGGILMGYGARLSGGCNIGAYFSAGASGSLSAWAWVAIALAGSALGLRLRSTLQLDDRSTKPAEPQGC
ncbi:MAG: YeeE/YedE family protein [Beijerinckiaceae bacterium]|nr:YeeE/YedE family protein [Beijerinckiaceae bacterium]